MISKLDPALWSCQILIFIINYFILIIIINSIFLSVFPPQRENVSDFKEKFHIRKVSAGEYWTGHLGLVSHFPMFEVCCRERASVMLLEFIAFFSV